MKIKNGNETVYEIITNHDFTLERRCNRGKIYNSAGFLCPERKRISRRI